MAIVCAKGLRPLRHLCQTFDLAVDPLKKIAADFRVGNQSDAYEALFSLRSRRKPNPRRKRKYALEELVAGITPENYRDEFYWGPRAGNEVC